MSITLVEFLHRKRKEREVLELEGELRLADFERAGASVRQYLGAVRADVATQESISIKDDIIGLIDRAEHWLNKENKKEAGVALAKLDRVLDAARDEISAQRIGKFVGKGKSVGRFWAAVSEILDKHGVNLGPWGVIERLKEEFSDLEIDENDNSLRCDALKRDMRFSSFEQGLSRQKAKLRKD